MNQNLNVTSICIGALLNPSRICPWMPQIVQRSSIICQVVQVWISNKNHQSVVPSPGPCFLLCHIDLIYTYLPPPWYRYIVYALRDHIISQNWHLLPVGATVRCDVTGEYRYDIRGNHRYTRFIYYTPITLAETPKNVTTATSIPIPISVDSSHW